MRHHRQRNDLGLFADDAGQADVTVAGSGNASFASDGDVKATIMGSGEVRVSGRAKCTVKSMGSGRLVCESPVATAKDDEDAKDDASDDN